MKSSDNRSAADVAIISLLSRALTLLGKTMYMAMFGATHSLLSTFSFALNLPQVIFTVVGAALNSVMIPVYSSLLAEERKDEAKKFIDNIITISMALIGLLVIVGMFVAPLITNLVAVPGSISYEHSDFLTFALRFLMPAMIFFGFGAIFQGLLQANGVFRLPALITVPGGVILIIYLVFFGERFGVEGLLFATALGFLTQPLIMLSAMRKIGYRYSFSFDLKNPHIRKAAMLSLPVLISVSSYQINFLFNNGMAVQFGTAAIMGYAQMLVQVFMLTIVYAIISVYFPKLSSLHAKADIDGYLESLRNAMIYIMFIVLPAAGGFLVLRYEIMDFLLGWQGGASGYSDIVIAGNLLGLYSIGIIAISMKEIMDRAFYSRQDSKTPALFGFLIMSINVGMALVLLPRLGLYSMPVAYCIAAFVGVLGLGIRLNFKIRFINFAFARDFCKIVVAVIIMSFAANFARGVEISDIKLVNLMIPAAIGVLTYAILAVLLRIPVALSLLKRGAN